MGTEFIKCKYCNEFYEKDCKIKHICDIQNSYLIRLIIPEPSKKYFININVIGEI